MQKIPLTQINSCHVVDYEHQLIPIVLSHCQYSLTYGKGQQIEYDFAALEKHILDRFIYGKPRIMLEIPNVVFKEDRYTEATFGAIRKKVHQVQCVIWVQREMEALYIRTCTRLMNCRFAIIQFLMLSQLRNCVNLDHCEIKHFITAIFNCLRNSDACTNHLVDSLLFICKV